MQIVIALSISTHCLLFMHRIPIILPPNKHPCCLSLSYVEASLPSMQDSKQQTNSCLVYAERTHTCWVCVCLPYLEIIKFLSCLHYISNQSVASFPDCGNSGLGMRLGKWELSFLHSMFWYWDKNAQVARVRPCNYVKFETGWNLLWVLKIVTHTVHRHKPLLLSMWPGVLLLVQFNNNLSGLRASSGVTHSYSSHPFLCALDWGNLTAN